MITTNLPDGFRLTPSPGGAWTLTIRLPGDAEARLDNHNPAALRRAAFALANVGATETLVYLIGEITDALGADAGPVTFRLDADPEIEYAVRYRTTPSFWRGRGEECIDLVSDGSLNAAQNTADFCIRQRSRGVRIVKRRGGGPWETHRKVGRRLTSWGRS